MSTAPDIPDGLTEACRGACQPGGARELKAAGRFRATVANYGSCKIASPYAAARQRHSWKCFQPIATGRS
jgi:hypothetical protein